jgi:hypothetical protein
MPPAGAPTSNSPSTCRARKSFGAGSTGNTSVAAPEASRGDEVGQRIEVDEPGARHQQEDRVAADQFERAPVERPAILLGDAGKREDHPRLRQSSLQRDRFAAQFAIDVSGNHGSWIREARAERQQQRDQRPAEVAAADQAHCLAAQHERLAVSGQPRIARCRRAQRVGPGDAAREVDRHAERHLGHRPARTPARRQHLDAAPEAFCIVDVLREVAFDVDQRLEPAGTLQPRRVEIGLPDNHDRFGTVRRRPL